jgi:hypothetical protein
MGATKARYGLFSLGMWVLGSLVIVDAMWAQDRVSFSRQDFGVGGIPGFITGGDFNGDGRPDLATANLFDESGDLPGSVSILLGQGDGTFQLAQAIVLRMSPRRMTVGDFNGDGRPDLATANIDFLTPGHSISILVGQGNGTFQAAQDFFVGLFSFEARLTNVSERSLSKLVVAVTTLTNANLLQNADGGPGGVGARLTVPQQDDFTDGLLSPNEFVDVPFILCLTQRRPFTFVVDILGEEE